MAKYKIFMTDCIFPDQQIEREMLAQIDADLVLASKADTPTFIKEGRDCDVVITVYATVDADFIGALETCRLIVKTGIGVNNIDVEAATRKGIMVANVPDYCISEVADHAMALLLAGVRKVCTLDQSVKQGDWDVNAVKPIPRLKGMTLGLLGFGNIAQQVARRAKAFDMEILAYDPYVPDSVFAGLGAARARDTDALFAASDILSLHAPLTPDTKHIVNAATIQRMKPSAYLVNTSRGALINETDLAAALRCGKLAGAALDVLNSEPLTADNELSGLGNVLFTPHAAFYSEGSSIELRTKSTADVVNTLNGGEPRSWLNKKAMQAHD